jgi:large subunit ribosomal protein L39
MLPRRSFSLWSHVRWNKKSAAILRHSSTLSVHPTLPSEYRTNSGLESKNEAARNKRTQMFNKEKARQLSTVPRLEKIEVEYIGQPENARLILNKNLSTPHDVAKHLSSVLIDRSAVALVNGDLWDMRRPFESDCTVELLHFHMENPFHVNKAFWRTCSFLLGSVLETVFKGEHFVELHSFPAPNVSSGSFVHDVDLKIPHWQPRKEELQVFSAALHRMAESCLPIERLEVEADLAKEMFEDNSYKTKQIPSIAASSKSGNSVTLYKVGDHVDMSKGPMVGDSSFLGRRCTIAAAHEIPHPDGSGSLYRFQGVALPKNMFLNHFSFGILERRAAQLNRTNLQQLSQKDIKSE